MEQRYAIKFCVKRKKLATKTFENLTEAYEEVTMSRNMVFRWYKAFKEGWENVKDESRSGRPISSTNAQNVVWSMVMKDHRVSVRMIADQTGLGYQIITDFLHMRKVCV